MFLTQYETRRIVNAAAAVSSARKATHNGLALPPVAVEIGRRRSASARLLAVRFASGERIECARISKDERLEVVPV